MSPPSAASSRDTPYAFLPNLLAQVPKASAETAAAVRTVFAQPDAAHVHQQLDVIAGMLGRQFPKLEEMLHEAAPELLALHLVPGLCTGRRFGRPTRWSGLNQVSTHGRGLRLSLRYGSGL